MNVCPKCKHLMDDGMHECPTAEYYEAKDRLIAGALDEADLLAEIRLKTGNDLPLEIEPSTFELEALNLRRRKFRRRN